MSKNLVYVDTETTGLDPLVCGLVQISMLFEKDGEVVDTYDSKVNCSTYTRDVAVNQTALDINGVKREDIESFPSVQQVVAEIGAKLYKNYGKTKVKLCGFNAVSFDQYFIKEMYRQTAWDYDEFYHYKIVDIFEAVKWLQYVELIPKTFKQRLVTLVEEFGLATVSEIEKHAHDSLWDIHMTRELSLYLKEKVCNTK